MIKPSRFFRPRLAYSDNGEARDKGRDQADQFRLVMLPHLDAAYNYACYLARDTDKAEDIVQDAFLRAFRGFVGYRGESARAWLLAIVRNCFLASVAADRRNSERGGGDTVQVAEPVETQTPETIAAARDDVEMLRGMIESLPEPFRETLVLRELEELRYKEIADLTQVPIGTVMSRLSRAREMLAELLLPRNNADVEARS